MKNWKKKLEHWFYKLYFGDETEIRLYRFEKRMEKDNYNYLKFHPEDIKMQRLLNISILPSIIRNIDCCESVTLYNLDNIRRVSGSDALFERHVEWIRDRMSYSGIKTHLDKLDNIDVLVFVIPEDF